MKKIIALVVAIVMMAAMAVPAFAEDIANNNANQDLTSETLVSFGVTQSYTVTIPAAVEISYATLDGTLELSANNVKIPGGKSLYISVYSENEWKLVDETNPANEAVDYGMKKMAEQGDPAELAPTGDKLADGAEILVVAAGTTSANVGAEGSSTVYLYTAGTGKVGLYTDTLNFKAEIK